MRNLDRRPTQVDDATIVKLTAAIEANEAELVRLIKDPAHETRTSEAKRIARAINRLHDRNSDLAAAISKLHASTLDALKAKASLADRFDEVATSLADDVLAL